MPGLRLMTASLGTGFLRKGLLCKGLFRKGLGHRGGVTVLFATAVIPLMMCIGLAVDYSFYAAAEAQLDMAADTASLHAVRAASQAKSSNMSYQTAGLASAQQWFAAEVTPLGGISINGGYNPIPASDVSIVYNSSSGSFTATVSYTGHVATHFGGLFGVSYWNIAGSATATISNSFVEVEMLIDNSSSMLIGATQNDIQRMEYLTECAPTATAVAAQQELMGIYSWNFTGNYGYYTNALGQALTPPTSTLQAAQQGSCYTNFSGPSSGTTNECFYPVTPNPPVTSSNQVNIQANGFCPKNYGVNATYGIAPSIYTNVWVPQAPCAFACHTGDGIHDYYTLVRNASPAITLRFDVVQKAAAQVIQTMESDEQVPNQFSVGVFQFNNTISQVYPNTVPFTEAGTDLATALTQVQNITTPITGDGPNTWFENAASYLAQNLHPAGDGGSATTPRKNLFIVTDGLDDVPPLATRKIGAMTNPANETNCAPIKALGFTIYVLYTPYYPLSNAFYLNPANGVINSVEPSTPDPPVVAALKACSSNSPTGTPYYYQASSQADINAAMQAMLQSALNSPGRLTN